MPGAWRVSFRRLGDPGHYQVLLHLMHDDPFPIGEVRSESCDFGTGRLEQGWRIYDKVRETAHRTRREAGERLAERWVR
jgi:hypothetical protein